MQVWLELANLPAKFHFRKQPGGTNHNAERQFTTFSRSGRRLFQKYLSLFEKQSVFIKSPHTTQLTFVYLRQLTLSQKAIRHPLRCALHGIKTLHIHSCSTLFLAGKITLIASELVTSVRKATSVLFCPDSTFYWSYMLILKSPLLCALV